MATYYSPKIVTDGLTLCLDAANYKSFVSGSTTWYDLVRRGFTGSLINGPTYTASNAGAIIFDGSNDYALIPSSSLVSSSQMTFSVWNFGISAQNSEIVWFENSSAVRVLGVALPWGDGTIYFDSGNGNGSLVGICDRISKSAGTDYIGWNYWTFTKNSSTGTMRIYRNGQLWHSGTGQNAPVGAAAGSAFLCAANVGIPGSVYHNGRIGIAKLYSRELSQSEVLQNYNATKTRFGLI